MSTMEQLNVRMDSDLKEKGTAALASIGLTPTEAVRKLWKKAAERGESLEKIEGLLSEGTETEPEQHVPDLEEGRQIMETALKRLGLYGVKQPDLTDEELMELEFQDRGML